MGWERKRGKLRQLNHFILTGEAGDLRFEAGDGNRFRGARYVITLDADTRLPPGTASRLVGTLAHPLNEPRFGPGGEVTSGYTVLQPRLETAPVAGERTIFQRLYQGERGIDLYTHAVSDVYQDLFGEGIYAGKGIYEVEPFERSLEGRVPTNALLSHDLFEGICGRAGLVTDIEVLEHYPSHVLGYMQRLHRWVRGDWQLLPWLLPRVPTESGRGPSPFTPLDRWKVADNLRRSLLAPGILALLFVTWLVAPPAAEIWILLAMGVFGVPSLLGAAAATTRLARLRERLPEAGPVAWRTSWQSVLRHGGRAAVTELGRWALSLTLAPYEAVVVLSAVAVTLWRLIVSRRHLLEWTSAAHAARTLSERTGPGFVWRRMAGGPLLSAGMVAVVAVVAPEALVAVAPLVAVWILSPMIAQVVSRPRGHVPATLGRAERLELRDLALATWGFFQEVVTASDHWLPPDNLRLGEGGGLARRTSPTNIAMSLMSALAAYDLGHLSSRGLAAAIGNTLDTVDRLEHHRGHLYNWYDTRELTPLTPRYVSTVDSGNLSAALIVLMEALREIEGHPVLGESRVDAFLDLTRAVGSSLARLSGGPPRLAGRRWWPGAGGPAGKAGAVLADLARGAERARSEPAAFIDLLGHARSESLAELDDRIGEAAESAASGGPPPAADAVAELRTSVRQLHAFVEETLEDAGELMPWTTWPHDGTSGGRPGEERSFAGLDPAIPLRRIPRVCQRALRAAGRSVSREEEREEASEHATRAPAADHDRALRRAGEAAGRHLAELRTLRERLTRLEAGMDYGFLFDPLRELFHIGFDVTAGALDPHHYDLLASEARVASLVAIARGQVQPEHWLHLGRPFAAFRGRPALLSWGGTLFEYLLPAIFHRHPPSTLLTQSCRLAVDQQARFGRDRGVPWGISESGFVQGEDREYGYRAFGVPSLGLRREPEERVVVTPYASLLGLSFAPRLVHENVRRLVRSGMLGRYGLYEALDFGADGKTPEVVRSYMSHHQGMILTSIASHLGNDVMADRFHRDARVESIAYLLHERIPWQISVRKGWRTGGPRIRPERGRRPLEAWSFVSPSPHPGVHVLSNGRYAVLVTGAGGGESRWRDIALTAWEADATREAGGTWIYLEDLETAELWSATGAPVQPDEEIEVTFAPHLAEFRNRNHAVEAWTRICVDPDEDAEIRRVTLMNHSDRKKRIAITSYGEVFLAPRAEARRHPAFARLFVESRVLDGGRALLFRQRPKSSSEPGAWLGHGLVDDGGDVESVSWETDRASFLGRRGSPTRPAALGEGSPLQGTAGATLDPVFAVRCVVTLEPWEEREVAFVTAAGRSSDEVRGRLSRFRPLSRCVRALERARDDARERLERHGLDPRWMEDLQGVLSAVLRPSPLLRPPSRSLAQNTGGPQGLWKFGISGDVPILLVRVRDPEDLSFVEPLVVARSYWEEQGVDTDLVVLTEEPEGYAAPLRDRLSALIERVRTRRAGREVEGREPPLAESSRGDVHLIAAGQPGEGDRVLLESAARAVLDSADSLESQVGRLRETPDRLPAFIPIPSSPLPSGSTSPLARPGDLRFDNGYGGFDEEGQEYVIHREPDRVAPAPWSNVIASPKFGFLATDSGLGCTWSADAGENRLTPWRNDPVRDGPSEAVYLRDEETGEVWTPTPLPAGSELPYRIRHGTGYTIYEHRSHGLAQEVRLFACAERTAKVVELRLTDLRHRPRRITATFYAEWLLGRDRERTAAHIVPDAVREAAILLARNPFRERFAERVAFVSASMPVHGFTADRTEFLGRGGLEAPAGLRRIGLSGTAEAGADPCAALQVHLDVPAGKDVRMHFVLGEGADRGAALELAAALRPAAAVREEWSRVQSRWDEILSRVVVHTPDEALDLMLNRWLPYQTLSSRLWGRTGFHQSSGAFGFRDQLQDVAALLDAVPSLAREHLLRAAGRQFEEGDVLHWWLPGTHTGVRTRCSDDLLWLPYVTASYVARTGDASVLDEEVPYLQAEPLGDAEHERYGAFSPTGATATLYQHGLRALERGLTRGPHGLPLIGDGDWNDGLDRVGRAGRGESVWLGWFLYATIQAYLPYVADREPERAARWREEAEGLQRRVEDAGWDGAWYRRAYYDDGEPLGSASGPQARIDSIGQSWAVLSGAAQPERARRAMDAVVERLMPKEDRLVLLLAPPFDRGVRDPGYIRAYPPGVRENGGQYTHAATWVGWAFAELGDGEAVHRVLSWLNPLERGGTRDGIELYRVEPFVLAGDVCGVPPYAGRGGWTWYTGSAGWMRRLGLEGLLGLHREGDRLKVEPRLPPEWKGFEVDWRVDAETTYHISVEREAGLTGSPSVELDGQDLADGAIRLACDSRAHRVRVRIAAPASPS